MDKAKPRRKVKDGEEEDDEMTVDEAEDVPEEPKVCVVIVVIPAYLMLSCISQRFTEYGCFQETIVEDGVFTMKIGPAPAKGPSGESSTQSTSNLPSHPHPRINGSMVVKGSKLFLYGGLFEDDERQHTLSDFYSIGEYLILILYCRTQIGLDVRAVLGVVFHVFQDAESNRIILRIIITEPKPFHLSSCFVFIICWVICRREEIRRMENSNRVRPGRAGVDRVQ